MPNISIPNTWIIDTGATDHIIHSVDCFTNITQKLNSSVQLPNGENVPVTHIGSVQISDQLILKDVLCVPSFSYNLISVSKLTSNQICCFIFTSNDCYIQGLTPWRMIGKGRRVAGLYLLQQSQA
ncbi:hypothetical protein F2P56_024089, partial [Juglans regia]